MWEREQLYLPSCFDPTSKLDKLRDDHVMEFPSPSLKFLTSSGTAESPRYAEDVTPNSRIPSCGQNRSTAGNAPADCFNLLSDSGIAHIWHRSPLTLHMSWPGTEGSEFEDDLNNDFDDTCCRTCVD